MGKISKILSNFAQSGIGKKIYTKALDPKNEKFINSTLPTAQVAVAELCGLGITVFNKKIDEEQRKQQTISHLLKAGTNLTIVGAISKCTANFAQTVADNINAPNSVKAGVKMGFPLVVATLTSRFIIPVILNNVSTEIRDKMNERKKLNFKA